MSLRTLLAWAWTLLILVLCWLPRGLLRVREDGPRPFFIPNLDKLVHLALFAGFAFLWVRASQRTTRGWWVLGVGLGLAVVTELGQATSFVGRDASVADALADGLGVGVGLLTSLAWEKLAQKRAPRPEV